MRESGPDPLANVSRETLDRIVEFEALLLKWTKSINLISRDTQKDIRNRHIRDSAQLYHLAPHSGGTWLDLGSGGGLPALVCAILDAQTAPRWSFKLIESDQRKSTFLRTAARTLGLNVQVLSERIENVPPLGAQLVTARALAALPKLLTLATPHGHPHTTYIFPKGASSAAEIVAAQADWRFRIETVPSITNPDSSLLILGDVTRA